VKQVDSNDLVRFDEMCAKELPQKCLEKSRSYGGKVVGLGFLNHPAVAGMGSPLQKKYGYRLTPTGFGVPLSQYNQFMKFNMEKNQALREAMTQLIDAEMSLHGALRLSAQERRDLVATIQNEILKGEIPRDLYQKDFAEMQNLKAKVNAAFKDKSVDLDKLKVRSSSNAEDIKGFNGAGLHDSYSAKISLSKPEDYQSSDCQYVMTTDEDTGLTEADVKPKTLACAIKGTYASLWNVRAIRERSFKKFDHRTASMGLSIQTSYKFRKDQEIRANSVLVTRVLGTENVYGQQLSTQVGNGLVTNPLPGTKAELAVIAFDNQVTYNGINILQYAKPKADQPPLTEKILSREDMLKISEIARDVEIQYCKAIPGYYSGDCKLVTNSQKKTLALDMEFKIYKSGEILIKQVRTFSGR
jgi:phosphoenolpyruvate synthase/pyruvate phosphate dikinase